jgi:hypothetical protein
MLFSLNNSFRDEWNAEQTRFCLKDIKERRKKGKISSSQNVTREPVLGRI